MEGDDDMWRIERIAEADYGCEERTEDEKLKCLVTVIDDNGNKKYVEVYDEWLVENELCEGDEWYEFFGWEKADIKAITDEYKGIKTPRDLYNALTGIWCEETCAPRLRYKWSKDNITLGQCSVTAFLAQDIFGGSVYGILREGGNFHCYNVVGNIVFDLTSEQFGKEQLSYEENEEQFRDVHFAGAEKRLRYEYLKEQLKKHCTPVKR